MTGRATITTCVALLVLLALPAHVAATGRLYEVVVAEETSGTTVKVACDGSFEYDTYRLEAPERFVVDFTGVTLDLATAVVPGDVYPVRQVRLADWRAASSARLIVDLDASAAVSVERVPEGILVRFAVEQPEMTPVEISEERQLFSLDLPPAPVALSVDLAEPGSAEHVEQEVRVDRDRQSDEPDDAPLPDPAPSLEPAELPMPETTDPALEEIEVPEPTALETESEGLRMPEPGIEPAPQATEITESAPEIETIRRAEETTESAPQVEPRTAMTNPASVESVQKGTRKSDSAPARWRSDGLAGEPLQEYSKRRRDVAALPVNPKGRYVVLILESSDRAEAVRWQSDLAQSGAPAFLNIVLDPVRGPRFRVLLGRFEDRSDAARAAERASRTHGVEATVLQDRGPR